MFTVSGNFKTNMLRFCLFDNSSSVHVLFKKHNFFHIQHWFRAIKLALLIKYPSLPVFLMLQTATNFAEETLFDIDDSTYDVDDSNALVPLIRTKHQAVAPRGHTHVELIDVKCDSKAGMLVTVEFEEEFSGIIYSQGYFSDPKCR